MGKEKKKKGCLGVLISFVITVFCLALTGVIFYLGYVIVTAEEKVDPVQELKNIPTEVMNLVEKYTAKGGEDDSQEGEEPAPQ